MSAVSPLVLPLVHASNSPLADVVRSCARVAASDATVLLTGETGTGKEVFARFVHQHSPRAAKPFVPVNCGAIPEALLESELFGHTKGAFTGAVNVRKGRVAMAEGGTLFLDEVGELPLSLQVKLLRLLQERSYEPVGSSESVHANFRLVAATHRDLAKDVEAGRFRRDLYYRLLVCPQHLPSLRERPADVTVLFHHFWSARGETRPVEAAVFPALEAYAWPGNVRELENMVERVSVCAEGESIRLLDLPPEFRPNAARQIEKLHLVEPVPPEAWADPVLPSAPIVLRTLSLPAPGKFPLDLPTMLRELEDSYIDAALVQAGGNKKAAADLLGLQRTTLVEKLKRRNRDSGQHLALSSAV